MREFQKWRAIAKNNGVSDNLYRSRVRKGWTCQNAATLPAGSKNPDIKEKDVAIYKGDTFIIWGSADEVAKKLGKTVRDVKWLCADSVRKRVENKGDRIYGIYIEDDEVAKND